MGLSWPCHGVWSYQEPGREVRAGLSPGSSVTWPTQSPRDFLILGLTCKPSRSSSATGKSDVNLGSLLVTIPMASLWLPPAGVTSPRARPPMSPGGRHACCWGRPGSPWTAWWSLAQASSVICQLRDLGASGLSSLSIGFLACKMGELIEPASWWTEVEEVNVQRVWHGAWLRNNTETVLSLQMPYAQEDRVPSCSVLCNTAFICSFIHSFSHPSFRQLTSVDQNDQVHHVLRRQKHPPHLCDLGEVT